ncbi:MAG: S1-like domain-containing RNA-binding protein [Lachnospiraceae bacterium]|nr:S1-like domain-containing RNA-binding protein [Lachnospiraceae bacterium]
MIELGKYQELTVVKTVSIGVYLGTSENAGENDRILLPKKQVPPETKVGDTLQVFVYKDSDDRLIATIHEVKVTLHQVARLKVSQMTKIGAFLDWGLEKDLLLPFHEQTKKLHEGEEVLAALYIDKSGRLAATMKVYPYLKLNAPYQAGDTVEGLVYQHAPNFGYFVAVDGQYSGLIPKKEAQAGFEVGQTLTLRVARVLEDGKLDLSAHQKAYLQMNVDADSVYAIIKEDYDGELPFDDKASPDDIRDIFGLSKAAFKRAVGHLYKEKRVALEKGRIRIVGEPAD